MNAWEKITPSIIGVGDGRGFVVQGMYDSYVIAAGHCLPKMPPCMSISHSEERTYRSLLGVIGAEPTIWTEVLFVDPISDLAVLGPPDSNLSVEHDAYQKFTEALPPVEIADAVTDATQWPTRQPAWFMTLDMLHRATHRQIVDARIARTPGRGRRVRFADYQHRRGSDWCCDHRHCWCCDHQHWSTTKARRSLAWMASD